MIMLQTRMLWLAKVNETSCASYHQINADQSILQRFALRRVARMLRSQQSANSKKLSESANLKRLSDVDTSENWDKQKLSNLLLLSVLARLESTR